ncbi:META domain-containing protein [Stakelama marina]|uniref:META domain-containing protein n=1 Tax=Stakelama marina TaxID=2826939 RepID=A0A8T4IC18_9SPHN|nr:META domain-containing protein [Stakelama marina]MBR0551642.1 META domain-containing protein [Stakelama marina]
MAVLALAILTGCAASNAQPSRSPGQARPPKASASPAPNVDISDTNWRIVSIDGKNATGARQPTMMFAGGWISGNAGCNSYSGPYSLDGDSLSVGPLMSSKKACVGGGMDTELTLFPALLGTLVVDRISAEQLTLTGSGHQITLRRAD